MKRRDEPYFALMATVVRCEAAVDGKPGFRQCSEAEGSKPVRIAKPAGTLTTTAEGELAFYVNDAAFSLLWKDMFYWNNKGQVWVRITRVRGAS